MLRSIHSLDRPGRRTEYPLKLARLVAAVWLLGSANGAAAPQEEPAAPAAAPTDAPVKAPVKAAPEDQEPEADAVDADADAVDADAVDAAAVEADIAAQELSDEAKDRLDAARESVVQIRGFFEDSDRALSTAAASRSTTRAGSSRTTMSSRRPCCYPQQYRLEYLASDGRKGPLDVLAIDVRNDLAIVAADDLVLPPLKLRTEIPAQGERAWSIGFPLNLGLTITEGVANGLVENSIEQRIHYTGAINGGMSGGPALDRRGRVYGVNVSVVTGRQLVGFVVPAKHIPALLARAKEPLDQSYSALQLRQLVTAQVLAYEAEVLEARPDAAGTQSVRGFVLPTQLSRHVECNTFDERGPHPRVRVETVSCSIPSRLVVQGGVIRRRAHRAAPDPAVGRPASPAVRTAGEPHGRGHAPCGRIGPRRAVRLPRRPRLAGRLRRAHLDLRAPVPAVRATLRLRRDGRQHRRHEPGAAEPARAAGRRVRLRRADPEALPGSPAMEAVMLIEQLGPQGHPVLQQRFAGAGAECRIGRDLGCDIVVDDEHAAPQHALLTLLEDGRVNVRDLGTRNGTRVDGSRVPAETGANIEQGEIIVGRTRLHVRTRHTPIGQERVFRRDFVRRHRTPLAAAGVAACVAYAVFHQWLDAPASLLPQRHDGAARGARRDRVLDGPSGR